MKYLLMTMFLIFLTFVLLGCNTEEEINKTGSDASSSPQQEDEERDSIQLTMWSYYDDGWDNVIEQFENDNPGVEVELKIIPYDEYPSAYMDAFISGDSPDLVIIDSPHIGDFKVIDGFEDLLQEPYLAEQYKEGFSEALWNMGLSFDQQNVIGIPYVTSPFLAYYRADIMEEYGFPSDPEELGLFMEDSNNWLEMARVLAEDDKYLVQWPMEILTIFESGTGMFDNELNFLRDNDTFLESIELAQTVHREDLFSAIDMWGEKGQAAIRNNQFAMLYLGSWGTELLKSWVPEQEGDWRMTRLPFDVNGWLNSSIISIPAASSYKEEAWEFIKFASFEHPMEGYLSVVNGYLPARNNENIMDYRNEFLGGQKKQEMLENIMGETEEPTLTPLDRDGQNIWREVLYSSLEWGHSPDEIMQTVRERLEAELGRDKEIILEFGK
ncbi:ABC transporter substrate-binding protein [Evansella sp. AB-P1]|uniref:ABC transporter substrate-binding protein n=1 Tax=Evansella sp. AB-P1 TaxID=3037653 RepID=UPI00241E5D21|nr:ABC transporter substrate-binding protein [Evansella sp. AB-P1]MDG5788002.1 ABC transporter substrate-binding protein [Evansella sp. AB-P1]